MEIRTTTQAGRTVLQPVGDIQVDTLNELRPRIDEELGKGAVIVDLSAVDFIDSSGLGLLISFAKQPLLRGRFLLVAPRRQVMEVIRIARLDSILEIHDSVAAATARETPRRILIIDPDEATRAVAEAVLESYDYSVQAVARIAEAVKTAFDLVVAGMIDREELQKRMADFGSPPLLLFVENTHGLEAGESDLLGYLVRPFDPYDLLGKVRILLGDRVGRGAKILALLADRALAEKVQFILERHDYAVTIAANSVAFRSQKIGGWSAYLVDADPKGGDSIAEIVGTIRENNDSAKAAIIVVGRMTAEEIRDMVSLGARDFLGVPLVPESLIGKLAHLVKPNAG